MNSTLAGVTAHHPEVFDNVCSWSVAEGEETCGTLTIAR